MSYIAYLQICCKYNIAQKQIFVMRATLMWYIEDFLVYGMFFLDGIPTHGKFTCPICMEDTKIHIKIWWEGNVHGWTHIVGSYHTIYLEGIKKKLVNGDIESRGPPLKLILEQV